MIALRINTVPDIHMRSRWMYVVMTDAGTWFKVYVNGMPEESCTTAEVKIHVTPTEYTRLIAQARHVGAQVIG